VCSAAPSCRRRTSSWPPAAEHRRRRRRRRHCGSGFRRKTLPQCRWRSESMST